MTTNDSPAKSGARIALGLLLAINLFNYIDRFVLAAVEPNIRATFFAPNDPNAMLRTGTLAPAFLFTYMIAAPILGFLADRFSRWLIVGVCVILWSFATATSGFAATFAALFITRIFVGIGEGGYGPAAPTILSDYFPLQMRGRIMAIFCGAIPVGSALGYVLGGIINHQLGWRWAFYLVAIPGIILGLACFWQRDPRPRTVPGLPKRQRGAAKRRRQTGPRRLPVQRRLLLRTRKRPRRLRPALLAEGEAQLAWGAQPVWVIGPEGRARLVEVERAQQVAAEVAVIARDLLRCCTTLRHFPDRPPQSGARFNGRQACKQDGNGRAIRLSANAGLFRSAPGRGCKRPEIAPRRERLGRIVR